MVHQEVPIAIPMDSILPIDNQWLHLIDVENQNNSLSKDEGLWLESETIIDVRF